MAVKDPRIPERVLDAPSQRLYILSLLLALQVLIIVHFTAPDAWLTRRLDAFNRL